MKKEKNGGKCFIGQRMHPDVPFYVNIGLCHFTDNNMLFKSLQFHHQQMDSDQRLDYKHGHCHFQFTGTSGLSPGSRHRGVRHALPSWDSLGLLRLYACSSHAFSLPVCCGYLPAFQQLFPDYLPVDNPGLPACRFLPPWTVVWLDFWLGLWLGFACLVFPFGHCCFVD